MFHKNYQKVLYIMVFVFLSPLCSSGRELKFFIVSFQFHLEMAFLHFLDLLLSVISDYGGIHQKRGLDSFLL